MVQDNQQQDKNNPLNDAVEHNATPDGNTDEHRAQDRQNQQNTMAATTATGADAAEQNDQVSNESAESNQGNTEDAGGQPGAEASGTEGSSGSQRQSGNADSSVQGGEAQQDDGNVEGSSAPQSVGGGTQQGSQSQSDGEGQNRASQDSNEQSPQPQQAGGSAPMASGQSVEPTSFDTETTSETFQVDVANATSKEMVIDGDYDTETVSETFEIKVDNVNDEVEIDEQAKPIFETSEDGQIVISEAELLANASDVDGDALSVLNLSIANASFEIQVDPDTGERSFVVTPDENVNGELAISFDVTDGQGSEVASSAMLNVAAVNDAAVVGETNVDGTEDTAITFTQAMLLQNASDVDSSELTAVNLHIDPQYGTLEDNQDGTFTFTPKDDFNGDVPFTFEVDDNDGSVTPASGTLDVEAVNDVPVFAETSYTIAEDGSITLSEASLLANVTDVDNDVLSISDISVEGNGTVSRDEETGDWTYTPDADYSGDAALKITVNDTKVDAVFTAPVTITPEADEPSLTVSL
ncbi:tandem-95 repeat protein, partial [Photobacterium sp. ZSDE20]